MNQGSFKHTLKFKSLGFVRF